MKEHPILFKAEMVRAILDGSKTQTRRVPVGRYRIWQVGDRMWVRETHYRWTGCGDAPPDWIRSPDGERYQSRGYIGIEEHDDLHNISAAAVKIPSIHMPRWASRILLEITEIREEKLSDISEDDINREGIACSDCWTQGTPFPKNDFLRPLHCGCWSLFCNLWDSINAARGYGWDTDPIVKVIKFEVT